jgi:DNA-directed RNA polymerase subunit RPC12/RpoP
MNRLLVNRRSVHFCPFCGLIADATKKGEYCHCPYCEVDFCVITTRLMEMSPRRKEESCKEKEGHATLQVAYDTWQEIKDRPIHNHSPMTVYLCELCGLFHLGHRPPKTVAYRSKLSWTMEEVEEELRRTHEAQKEAGGEREEAAQPAR